ncbi:MAG: glycoside hydrolase family 9 protein [Melioribacteraceae bacterium]|nr:glycoside hydrolase family 9 protein [Melioribacteraceae bacterium]
MKFFRINLFIFLFFLFGASNCQTSVKDEQEVFIRTNQLGFLPGDVKTAVVLSNNNLKGKEVFVYNVKNEKVVTLKFQESKGSYGKFLFSYLLDFSSLNKKGEYFLQFGKQKSYLFKIDDKIFNGIAESLLDFFKVQRCGYTSPLLHDVCHISDATSIIENGKGSSKSIDVTGGWHDAGDYIKNLNTTAFSTYMLLFSYEFAPEKFSFDKNKNNVPDILEEAKIGLDWLNRAYFEKNKLITQVQDMRDHDVGWRMPENDPLGFDRPAFVGIGKNLIGIYSATLALAYRIWKEKLNYPEFANQCLDNAQKIYSIHKQVKDVDSSGIGVYIDKNFYGKLSLGAIELYLSTMKSNYLNDAAIYADSAKSDFWWSWGDVNSLAHYRLAKFITRFSDYLKNNLEHFNKLKNGNVFGKAVSSSWGTNVTLLGITLQNILYKRINGKNNYDSLSVFSRDYILGRNPWGISFINGIGKNSSKNFHHQIGYLKGKLPGGFAAGPASKEFVDKLKIPYEKIDPYARFQTNDNYYRDDRNDYITNEPTIVGNATAIFVFGVLSN